MKTEASDLTTPQETAEQTFQNDDKDIRKKILPGTVTYAWEEAEKRSESFKRLLKNERALLEAAHLQLKVGYSISTIYRDTISELEALVKSLRLELEAAYDDVDFPSIPKSL